MPRSAVLIQRLRRQDFDGLVVEVDAVQVVFEDPLVEVEQRAVAAELVEAVVGVLVDGVELVEGFDEERAAAAGGVEDAQGGELVLPGFPEFDEGGFWGFG